MLLPVVLYIIRSKKKHPYLGEKIPWGLVPYVQALLLARTLRDDLEMCIRDSPGADRGNLLASGAAVGDRLHPRVRADPVDQSAAQ